MAEVEVAEVEVDQADQAEEVDDLVVVQVHK